MKTRALVMAGMMALTVMASTRIARAQEAMVVNIPFDFVAGNAQLPAGEYSVTVKGPVRTLILMERKDANAAAFINTNAAVAREPQSESKLVFNRYGDHYFLSQIWTAGDASGRQLSKSPREKEMAQVATLEDRGQVVLVASLTRTTR